MIDDQLPAFTVSLTDDGSVAVLTVRGDIDYSSAGTFRYKLNDAMRRSQRVVIDLRAVNYMESASVRLMLVAGIQRDAGTFVLRGVGGALLQQLRFTGVLDILEVEQDSTES